jgi:hypothetical protein
LKYLFYISLFFYSAQLYAEERELTNGKWNLQLRFDYGFIIAHRPQLEPVQEEHVKGFEISFEKFSTGLQDWQRIYNYPGYGLTIAGFNLGSPDKLGKGICAYPYVDFPLGKSSSGGLHFRYGMGIGYVEKIFDEKTNQKNSAIGSHINGVIHFDLHVHQKLSPQTFLEFGAGITHFSNGSFSMPNLGINIATANVALRHAFGDRLPIIRNPLPVHLKTREIHLYAGGFYKKIYPPNGRSFFAGTLSGMYFKKYSLRSAWGIGADLFYDNSISYRIETMEGTETNFADNIRQGIYGAYHLTVGKVGVMFNMGFYLYNPWKDDGNAYHRICLRYYMEKTFICLNLKSHYARADFIELGFGYRFKNKS